jgi:hypothetical protein
MLAGRDAARLTITFRAGHPVGGDNQAAQICSEPRPAIAPLYADPRVSEW